MMAVQVEYYNEELKNAYLETIDNKHTFYVFEAMFKKTKSSEQFFDKDLLTFNLEQLEFVFKNFSPATVNSASNLKSRIKNYIDWGIKNGHRQNNSNPLHATVGWERQFVDEITERHLSAERIKEILNEVPNYQDKALVQCIFEGISGRGLSELMNLKYEDIDFDNKIIHVIDDKDNEREVNVSDISLSYLDKAYHEKTYVNILSGVQQSLMDCGEHVFKNNTGTNSKHNGVTKTTLPKRLARIKEKFHLDEFSTSSISESGQIKYAADLYKENKKVDRHEYDLICKQFNTPRVITEEYDYPNTYKLRQYINNNNLKELYDIDLA